LPFHSLEHEVLTTSAYKTAPGLGKIKSIISSDFLKTSKYVQHNEITTKVEFMRNKFD
jgi:hypothetical protein